MNRRLVLAAVVAAAVGGGLAAPALASSTEGKRHVICVLDGTPTFPNQEGLCIGWNDPMGTTPVR